MLLNIPKQLPAYRPLKCITLILINLFFFFVVINVMQYVVNWTCLEPRIFLEVMSAESNFRGKASFYIMIKGYKDILEYWVIWNVPPNC